MAWTYTTLSQAVQDYTQVTEPSFIANIPNFIQNAEDIINNSVQLPAFRKNVTGETTQGFPYINAPSDFLSVFSLAVSPVTVDTQGNYTLIGPYTYLLNKDVNYIREAYPFPGSPTGLPQYYSLFSDTSFLIGPTPDACYGMELHYYAYPPSITVANTSWVGTNFPNVLLWGSLVEAYIYVKGENDLVQTYQAKFDQALAQLKQLGDSKDREDSYRTVQVRDKTV